MPSLYHWRIRGQPCVTKIIDSRPLRRSPLNASTRNTSPKMLNPPTSSATELLIPEQAAVQFVAPRLFAARSKPSGCTTPAPAIDYL